MEYAARGGKTTSRCWFNRAAGRSREYANAAMGTLGIRLVRDLGSIERGKLKVPANEGK